VADYRAEGLATLGLVDRAFGVSGSYLDAEAAAASIAGVRGQGIGPQASLTAA
jgi:hypothetical protein